MRYTGPKDRLSRREGTDLFGKGAKLTRLNIPPGVHGQKGGRQNVSDYGRQLREKQKTKRIYGVSEQQFKKYVVRAEKIKDLSFLEIMERRLDNVVYRLGFAKTRPGARQIVSHRHTLVDGKIVNIPSYEVRTGQRISLDGKALNINEVKQALENKNITLPSWLVRKAAVGKVKSMPVRTDITEPISEQDIVEFYSR